MKSLVLHNGQLKSADFEALLDQDQDYPEKSVYTSIRTYDGKTFRLDAHLVRLLSSARLMGFTLRWPLEAVRSMILRLVQASEHDPQFLKVVATPSSLYALSRPLQIDHAIYKGVSVGVVDYVRDHVKAKWIPEDELTSQYEQAAKAGYHDVLLRNSEEKLTEGSRSNLLWIIGDTLYWCDQALSGITQAAVIEWVQQSRPLKVVKTDGLPMDQLGDIDELFLSQTSRGVVPIVQVGDQEIGSGKVGTETKAIMQLFHQQILLTS